MRVIPPQQPFKEALMPKSKAAGLTRRQVLKAGAATTFAGYAVGVEKALGQAIKTDTQGIVAGDAAVAIGGYQMPVYEARPANATNAPIVIVISEIWGVHEWVKDVTRRFAKDGYYAVPRKQVLGDVAAAVDWTKKRPGARADRVGVTGHCWGGSTVYQVAATNPDIRGAVAWYGPPARPYPDTPNPVTGFDVVKDIKAPFLGLYGEKDTSPTPDDAKKFGELLKQTNKDSEVVVYPNVGHGFFADYRPSYNAEAAADAWKRCTGLFARTLKA